MVRGFLDIYPGQAFPPHLQSLVSGYATYQACGIESINARAFIRTYEDRERIWCLAGMHEVNILELRFWTARRSVVDRLDENGETESVLANTEFATTMRRCVNAISPNRVKICTQMRAQAEAPPKPWESETRERFRSSGNRYCSCAARSSKSSSSARSLPRRSGTFCETFSIIARRRRTT